MKCRSLLLSLCLLAGLVAGSQAQRPPTLLPPPGALTTAVFFPDHPDKNFPAGDTIKVVVAAHNDAPKPYNLSAIIGSLGSAADNALQFQNFTTLLYGELLGPGEERSLEYQFQPLSVLAQGAPREFQVALHLIYSDPAGTQHASTFFNQTINVTEPPKAVDTELLFMVLILAAIVAGIVYLAYDSVSEKLGLAKRTKKRASKARPVAFDEADWVKGTTYDASKRKRASASKKTVVATADADS